MFVGVVLLSACAGGGEGGDGFDTDSTATAQDSVAARSEGVKRSETTGRDRGQRAGDAAAKTGPNGASDSTRAEVAIPVREDAFELVEDAKANYYTLPTFANDIDDMNVRLDDLSPWEGEPVDFLGTYYGSLDNEITGVRILAGAPGQVTLIFSYSAEVAKETGEIDYEEGEKAFAGLSLAKTTVEWRPVMPVYSSQGQFVTWTTGGTTYYGLLTKGRNSQGKPPFVLFRRTEG